MTHARAPHPRIVKMKIRSAIAIAWLKILTIPLL